MISETVASREAALSGRLAFLNTGTANPNAAVQIYDGVRPANASLPPPNPMLVSIPLDNPAGFVGSGVLTLDPLEPGLIVNSGNPTWARVVNRNGATAFDMDAGVAGSGPGGSDPECILSTDTLFAGGQVAIIAAVLG